MELVTIDLDGVLYEIPAAVEARMRAYLTTMNILVESETKRTEQLREVARLDTVSRRRGATKDDRLKAHYAKKELLNLYR